MRRNITLDASDAIRKLKALARELKPSQVNLALARAINRAGAMSKTRAGREIRKEYKIGASRLNSKIRFYKASRYKVQGKISAWGTPLPIHYFRPRQTKKGVRINVSGSRKLIKHAFIATVRGGTTREHTAVWMRGKYTPTGFKYESGKGNPKNRMNFKKLVTVSQGVMFSKPVVIDKTLDSVQELLPKRFEHEMQVILAGIA